MRVTIQPSVFGLQRRAPLCTGTECDKQNKYKKSTKSWVGITKRKIRIEFEGWKFRFGLLGTWNFKLYGTWFAPKWISCRFVWWSRRGFGELREILKRGCWWNKRTTSGPYGSYRKPTRVCSDSLRGYGLAVRTRVPRMAPQSATGIEMDLKSYCTWGSSLSSQKLHWVV